MYPNTTAADPVRYRPSALSRLYALLDEIAELMVVFLVDPAELRRVWPEKGATSPLVVGRMQPGGCPVILVDQQALDEAKRDGDEHLLRRLYAALDGVSGDVLAADSRGQPVACAL